MRARLQKLIIAAAVGCIAAVGAPVASAHTGPGTLYTFAGAGTSPVSTTGIKPAHAALMNPAGLAVDAAGDVAITDSARGLVALYSSSSCATDCRLGLSNLRGGRLQAVTGFGSSTPTAAGVSAIKASIPQAATVSFDPSGDLVIADLSNHLIDLLSNQSCSSSCPYGFSKLVKGYVYRVAGGGLGSYSSGIAARSMNVYPLGTTYDSRGDMIVSDGSERVLVDPAHSCSSGCPFGLSSMTAGHLYAIAGTGSYGFTPPNGVAGTAGALASPNGIAVDGSGNVVFADAGASAIELIAAHSCASNCPYGLSSMQVGYIYTLSVLNGGSGGISALSAPQGVAIDRFGDVLIGNTYGNQVEMLAGFSCSSDCPYGLSSMTAGHLYAIAGTGTFGNAGTGVAAATAKIADPQELAVDPNGGLFMVDAGSYLIREVTGSATRLRLAVWGHGRIAGGGKNCRWSCASVHAAGSTLSVSATPASGVLFAGWIGGDCRGVGVCKVELPSSRVHAVFRTRSQLAHRVHGILARIRGKNTLPKLVHRHNGYRVKFSAPAAVKLGIAWRARVHHHSRLLAIGRVTPARVGSHAHLKIKLTRAGRRILKANHRRRVTVIASLHVGQGQKVIKVKRRRVSV